MKRMTKTTAIAILCLLTNQGTQAGWLSNMGQRIVQSAVNTVEGNVKRKVNNAVNDTMDGKIGKTSKKNQTQAVTSSNQGSSNTSVTANDRAATPTPSSKSETPYITYTDKRGKAIKYTNNYTDIDLGSIFKFKGEYIYKKSLEKGQIIAPVVEFLDPGLYVISIRTTSDGEEFDYESPQKEMGVGFGFGIIHISKNTSGSDKGVNGRAEGDFYLVEVMPNTQGHLKVTLMNAEALNESGELKIYKVPEAPKWLK